MTVMLKHIDVHKLRDFCDDLSLMTKIDGNRLIVTLRADENFEHDVLVIFQVEEMKISIFGIAVNFAEDIEPRRAIRICNQWNMNRKQPKACYDSSDGIFRVEICFFNDAELSDDYYKDNVIRASLGFIWQFFAQFKETEAEFDKTLSLEKE